MTIPGASLRISGEDRVLRRARFLTWPILLSVLLLAVIGLATVRSASAELGSGYLPRQAVWASLGLLVFALMAMIDYRFWLRISPQLYLLGLAAVTLVTFFGVERGGARSWIGVAGLGGQPSDFLKFATMLVLARYLAEIKSARLQAREVVVAILIAGLPMLAIAVQPDLGGAAMLLPVLAGMLLVCGLPLRASAIAVLVLVVGGAGLWSFGMRPYQRDRILSFVSPERDPRGAGYQVRQSRITVGSGQLTGRGYMEGTQSQLRFLPACHTDFIFAVLAEERGFVGVAVVFLLYAWFLRSAVQVALRGSTRVAVLLASGLLAVLSAHVLYNTAMMLGLVPVTGIPLPFLSYGGSFTLFCFAAAGTIASIDVRRYVNR